jgi:hypothetical protein
MCGGGKVSLKKMTLNAFSHVYEQAAAAAATSPCQSVYALLAALCGIHLDPAARGNSASCLECAMNVRRPAPRHPGSWMRSCVFVL